MPDLEGAEEITIGAWSKKKGDHVDEGETLLEALTDKVNAEIPSPVSGVVEELLASTIKTPIAIGIANGPSVAATVS